MKFIFGLGNPGIKYEKTRHNVGFMVADALARELNATFNQQDFKSVFFSVHVQGEKIFVIKPETFMNLSGESVRMFLDYYNASAEDILVIYDDMDMPVGKIRLRKKGSAGGHNGIKSIIQHLGTNEFKRLKIGIGRPMKEQSVVSHVLSRFSPEDEHKVEETVGLGVAAIDYWLSGSTFEETMTNFN